MLRKIENRLRGRKKSIDENPSIQEALALLSEFEGNIKGNFTYFLRIGNPFGITPVFTLNDIALKDMVNFVEEKYPKNNDNYVKVRYQVYSGEKDEKHYLKLIGGCIEGKFGESIVEKSPIRKSSIDFIIEKQE